MMTLATLFLLLINTGTTYASGHEGKGWIPEPNDQVVTLFGFGLIVFFTLFVVMASAIQGKLGKRKRP